MGAETPDYGKNLVDVNQKGEFALKPENVLLYVEEEELAKIEQAYNSQITGLKEDYQKEIRNLKMQSSQEQTGNSRAADLNAKIEALTGEMKGLRKLVGGQEFFLDKGKYEELRAERETLKGELTLAEQAGASTLEEQIRALEKGQDEQIAKVEQEKSQALKTMPDFKEKADLINQNLTEKIVAVNQEIESVLDSLEGSQKEQLVNQLSAMVEQEIDAFLNGEALANEVLFADLAGTEIKSILAQSVEQKQQALQGNDAVLNPEYYVNGSSLKERFSNLFKR